MSSVLPDFRESPECELRRDGVLGNPLHCGFTVASFTRLSCANMDPQDLGIGRLFERIQDAVIVAVAKTQRIVLWNPAATNIFGYSASEALELRVEDLVPEYLKEEHRRGIAPYAKTGHGPYIDSHRPLELPAIRRDGRAIYVELSLSPIGLVDKGNDDKHF